MHPNEDIDKIGNNSAAQISHGKPADVSPIPKSYCTVTTAAAISPASEDTEDKSEDDDTEEDLGHISLSKHLNKLSLEAGDRFYGQSRYFTEYSSREALLTILSIYMFSKDVSGFRSQAIGDIKSDFEKFRRPIYWQVRPVSVFWNLSHQYRLMIF